MCSGQIIKLEVVGQERHQQVNDTAQFSLDTHIHGNHIISQGPSCVVFTNVVEGREFVTLRGYLKCTGFSYYSASNL